MIAGTGSVCYGRRTADGREVRGGGWGGKLGDEGSGFAIGSAVLKLGTARVDAARQQAATAAAGGDGCAAGSSPPLVAKLLAAAGLPDPSDGPVPASGWDRMIDWAATAPVPQVAGLAPVCLEMAKHGEGDGGRADGGCLAIVQVEAAALAKTAAGTLRALAGGLAAGEHAEVLLCGGLFGAEVYQAAFCAALSAEQNLPNWSAATPSRPSVVGAVALASKALADSQGAAAAAPAPAAAGGGSGAGPMVEEVWRPSLAELGAKSPTELRNERSTNLATLPTVDAVKLFLSEDAALPAKVAEHAEELARLVEAAAAKLAAGGRLLYAGAGSSGRLGVLDAAECPPTYGTDPSMVQGLIAGGSGAILKAVEGAEDSAEGGRADAEGRGDMTLLGGPVGSNDLLVGIAASGRTPYIWGAMAAARDAGAAVALLCFNPNVLAALDSPAAAGSRPDFVIAVDAGPEVLTGSTRLKVTWTVLSSIGPNHLGLHQWP